MGLITDIAFSGAMPTKRNAFELPLARLALSVHPGEMQPRSDGI